MLDAAALVEHLVPADTVHGFLAEHRLRLVGDEMFADLLSSRRGQPSVPVGFVTPPMLVAIGPGRHRSIDDPTRVAYPDVRVEGTPYRDGINAPGGSAVRHVRSGSPGGPLPRP